MAKTTVTVTHNGATITVGPTTPRSKLMQSVLALRLSESIVAKATELNTNLNIIDRSVTDLIKLSSWIIESTGLDFEPLNIADDTETIWRKWEAWLDTSFDILFRKTRLAVDQLDNPNPPSRSPQEPAKDAPKA